MQKINFADDRHDGTDPDPLLSIHPHSTPLLGFPPY